ncbi:hypothetical protein [Streptomyces sp. CA2R106]|uniref:hypothetical protein n=1 Tax=Streptomyces sp. CA2R106 TaxID=3120153 RepID=UPI0030094EAD
MVSELRARTLTWAEADPARHPFAMDADAARELTGHVEPLLPGADVGPADRWEWLATVTEFLVGRYGRWACGWNWSVGEGDTDGGIVEAWCCAHDSMTAPDETAPLVVEGLRQWRGWLEDLAQRFTDLAPPDTTLAAVDRRHWERACTRLVTVVADRTHAESGWYGHCTQVLGWFLACHGIDEDRAREIVENAVGGRFGSWIAPDTAVVDEVSTRFAGGVGGSR